MSKPDWENFAKAVLEDWPTGDLDGSVLFDLALQYGMIQEVPGGYNSDHHIDADGICPEEGDPWYVYTFRVEAGPGLYSIADMTKRIKELEDENHLLKTAGIIEVAVRNPNVMEYMKHWEGRAEKAEAKLAKAVKALEKIAQHDTQALALNALAELKGETDE